MARDATAWGFVGDWQAERKCWCYSEPPCKVECEHLFVTPASAVVRLWKWRCGMTTSGYFTAGPLTLAVDNTTVVRQV